jgi:hypothetical protein
MLFGIQLTHRQILAMAVFLLASGGGKLEASYHRLPAMAAEETATGSLQMRSIPNNMPQSESGIIYFTVRFELREHHSHSLRRLEKGDHARRTS